MKRVLYYNLLMAGKTFDKFWKWCDKYMTPDKNIFTNPDEIIKTNSDNVFVSGWITNKNKEDLDKLMRDISNMLQLAESTTYQISMNTKPGNYMIGSLEDEDVSFVSVVNVSPGVQQFTSTGQLTGKEKIEWKTEFQDVDGDELEIGLTAHHPKDDHEGIIDNPNTVYIKDPENYNQVGAIHLFNKEQLDDIIATLVKYSAMLKK